MAAIEFNSEKINNFFKGKNFVEGSSYVDEVFCDDNKVNELKSLLSKQFNEKLSDDGSDNKDLDHILFKIHYDINTRLSTNKDCMFDKMLRWILRIAVIMVLPIIIFTGIQ